MHTHFIILFLRETKAEDAFGLWTSGLLRPSGGSMINYTQVSIHFISVTCQMPKDNGAVELERKQATRTTPGGNWTEKLREEKK